MSIPSHLNEKIFRQYEPYISRAVLIHPNAFVIDPNPLSINTFAARLRDSFTSLARYNWPTEIDLATLTKLGGRIPVRIVERDGISLVRIGGFGVEEPWVQNSLQPKQSERCVSQTTDAIIRSVLILKLYDLLPEPYRFISPSNPDQIVSACTESNLSYVIDNNDVIIL